MALRYATLWFYFDLIFDLAVVTCRKFILGRDIGWGL